MIHVSFVMLISYLPIKKERAIGVGNDSGIKTENPLLIFDTGIPKQKIYWVWSIREKYTQRKRRRKRHLLASTKQILQCPTLLYDRGGL
jgi:hypothetical protein